MSCIVLIKIETYCKMEQPGKNMEQMMKHAENEMFSDKEFAEEVFLLYTEPQYKRHIAEQNMVSKLRSCFKQGSLYGLTILDTIFSSEACSKEDMFRQRIEMGRMDARMKRMEETVETTRKDIHLLTQEKVETQEAFYDCQAELIQQKEYVALLQAEDAERKEKGYNNSEKSKNTYNRPTKIWRGLNGPWRLSHTRRIVSSNPSTV